MGRGEEDGEEGEDIGEAGCVRGEREWPNWGVGVLVGVACGVFGLE